MSDTRAARKNDESTSRNKIISPRAIPVRFDSLPTRQRVDQIITSGSLYKNISNPLAKVGATDVAKKVTAIKEEPTICKQEPTICKQEILEGGEKGSKDVVAKVKEKSPGKRGAEETPKSPVRKSGGTGKKVSGVTGTSKKSTPEAVEMSVAKDSNPTIDTSLGESGDVTNSKCGQEDAKTVGRKSKRPSGDSKLNDSNRAIGELKSSTDNPSERVEDGEAVTKSIYTKGSKSVSKDANSKAGTEKSEERISAECSVPKELDSSSVEPTVGTKCTNPSEDSHCAVPETAVLIKTECPSAADDGKSVTETVESSKTEDGDTSKTSTALGFSKADDLNATIKRLEDRVKGDDADFSSSEAEADTSKGDGFESDQMEDDVEDDDEVEANDDDEMDDAEMDDEKMETDEAEKSGSSQAVTDTTASLETEETEKEADEVGKTSDKEKAAGRKEDAGDAEKDGGKDSLAVKVTITDGGDDGAASKDGSEFPSIEISNVCTVEEMDDGSKQGKNDEDPDPDADKTDVADGKTYAVDTMNELLGLFGYDKMGENESGKKGVITTEKSQSDGKPEEGSKSTKPEEQAKAETDKSKSPGKSRINMNVCTECNKAKSCKYQVLMHGIARYVCDDNCFKAFRTRQRLTAAMTTSENRPVTRSLTATKDYCNICRKEIKNGQGLLPGIGENKPLCSESCMKRYQVVNAPKRTCAQCGKDIQGRNKCLTWETMEYCNEECLGKYQSFLGSHCACCKNAVQRTSLGKYCVRFGSDIKQFCSNNCLEEFKKGLKVCSFCQKDISSGSEGFLAPVGDKGLFKDFCSQQCMEKFETMNRRSTSEPAIHQCSVCNKTSAIKVQVVFEGKSHKLCSEPCIAAFRYANKINTSICDTCHKFFDVDASQPHTIQFEGLSKRFCAKSCMNVFVLSHRKIVPCTWCKVKKYNFDMIERVDSNNHVQLFCSLNCLSLFRVSLNATSSRSIRCDYCTNTRPAQYHLTMSDASIRNFCSYQCVMSFQSQFTNVAPVTPATTATAKSTTTTITTSTAVVTTTGSQTSSGTPVISSVMSLAPTQQSKIVVPARQQTTAAVIAAPVLTMTKQPTVTVTTSTSSSVGKPVSTPSQIVTQQVIIKPPPPKQVKNKSLQCRPFMQTKGVSCKPHPCHKMTQTEPDAFGGKPVLIPVPIPVYVPTPMHMYVNPVPFPVPFPLPIPVPVFIPTAKTTTDAILKQIKEIQEKIPANPFEAELLMMAEMVANNSGGKANGKSNGASSSSGGGSSGGEQAQSNDGGDESGAENQLSDGGTHATSAFSEDMLQMALRMATEMDEPAMDIESALGPGAHQSPHDTAFNSIEENNSNVLSPRELRARNRSQKRTGGHRGRPKKRSRTDENSLQMTPSGVVVPADNNSVLKYTYGVNAWKHWVLEKNTQLEKANQSNRKLKLFKTDLLQLTADELNYSLCLFVKEVRKPNKDEYAPDSIFYLCLGIQQYLFENGRIDNIFTDAYYEKFTECLNEVLQKTDSGLGSEGVFHSRIEEEILWEAKQLGAHSPHVLLNTLMYFNTKFFMLRTVDDHMKLSFTHVMKHWRKTPTGPGRPASTSGGQVGKNVLLRYCPPPTHKGDSGRKRSKDDQSTFEQMENLDNPLRCPVKLYEFYLSKCPESIKNRSDIFYLYPERSCVPDSPVWYSTMPLGKEAVAKMLQRIKTVREVCEVF